VDSGLVQCIVTDSLAINDTTISWSIQEHSSLLHTHFFFGTPDTSFWTWDTVTFSLLEQTTGMHRLVTMGSQSRVWAFGDSLWRLSDSSNVVVAHRWSDPSGSGSDSLYYADSVGFFRGRMSSSVSSGLHYSTVNRLEITLLGVPTVSVEDNGFTPHLPTLDQNYPNPFNPTTTLSFSLAQRSEVSISVYDLLGRRVALILNGVYAPGKHEALFSGAGLPSGIYFYRLCVGGTWHTKKMILQK
jgi:hypothetical protein